MWRSSQELEAELKSFPDLSLDTLTCSVSSGAMPFILQIIEQVKTGTLF